MIVDFLKTFKKYLRDQKFREWCQWYKNEDKDILIFEKKGDKCKGKVIFYIPFDNEAWGFFAYWKFSIVSLACAEKYGMIPVIDWTKHSPYYDTAIEWTDNPFEYYFEPINDITVDEARKAECVFTLKSLISVEQFKGKLSYDYENQISNYLYFNKKYFCIKDNVKDEILQDISKLSDIRDDKIAKKTLAVHIRGVEWGNIQGHPVPLNVDEYTKAIDKAINEFAFERIFLATDSEDTLELLQKHYANRVICYDDVIRSKKGSSTLAIFDNTLNSRPLHKYKLGYEVLRDMYTLSMCDGLIAGYSNISLAARVFKESRDEKYLYFEILRSEKIVTNGIPVQKAVKKMKNGKWK